MDKTCHISLALLTIWGILGHVIEYAEETINARALPIIYYPKDGGKLQLARFCDPIGLICEEDFNTTRRQRVEYSRYHRITEAPQVKPAPKATSMMRLPSFTIPCSSASLSAMGNDAAVVFPYR